MPLNLKNIEYIKALKLPGEPEFGTKLAELLSSMNKGVTNIEQQTNSSAEGPPPPPPAVNALMVNASNGHFQIAINHEGSEFYRGIRYFVEHADNPAFVGPHTVDMGTARNANLFLGNSTRYFRAFAAYPGSAPGRLAYHGTAAQPRAVVGGGSIPGPSFSASQGSGTGDAGVGHSGPGPVPFRASTGGPPIR